MRKPYRILVPFLAAAPIACGGYDEAELGAEENVLEDELISATDERRPPQGPDLVRVRSTLTYRPIDIGSARKPDGSTYSSIFTDRGELRERYLRCETFPSYRCFWSSRTLPAIGTTFRTRDSAYELRINNFRAATGPGVSGSDYDISYRAYPSGTWYPICSGAYNEAVPFMGYYDSAHDSWIPDATRVSFACHDSATFKVISWGYAPERHPNHFRAAVRAARADYCGTGDAYTNRGTQIEIFDRDGIRTAPAPSGAHVFEAAWSADEISGEFPVAHGAVCLSKLRWRTLSPSVPMPGSPACTSLPYGGEFEAHCDARTLGEGGEPTSADYSWMESQGAIIFTRSSAMY